MALSIDTDRKVHGPRAREQLVQAIRVAPADEPELHWLEWKREADLADKAWRGELASHILGFANRLPETAARACEGYAYLVVGVEPGQARGVDAIDPAQLDDALRSYLGAAGPRWEPAVVDLDGVRVLVITVDPPRDGDPVWMLRKGFEDPGGKSRHDGQIFIRRNGLTASQPSSAELDALLARQGKTDSSLDLELIADEEVEIGCIDLSPDACERWLSQRQAGLLSSLPAPLGPMQFRDEGAKRSSGLDLVLGGAMPDLRSPEEFKEEVAKYLKAAEAVLPEMARTRAVKAGLGTVNLTVENHTRDNFHSVLVEIHIEGEVMAFFEAEDASADISWPGPPHVYGKKTWASQIPALTAPSFDVRPPKPRRGWTDNSASARIRFEEFDLRPSYTRGLAPVYLLADQSLAGAAVELMWHATSTSLSGLAEGALIGRVQADPVDPRKLL